MSNATRKPIQQYVYGDFPDGDTFINFQDEHKHPSTRYIRRKMACAFQYSLRKVDWQLFLTLKFRRRSYNSLKPAATQERKRYAWELLMGLPKNLLLSRNDIQFFATEEVNANDEAHYHILIFCARPEKASVEATRQMLLMMIDPKIIVVPKMRENQAEEPHLQTIKNLFRAVDYVLKTPIEQQGEKPYFHSEKFARFTLRHEIWKNRNKH
jgi:hypothetical protein